MTKHRYAIFDVDTRTIDPSFHPVAGGVGLSLMAKAKPIRAGIERLLGWAERAGVPEVMTVCLSTAQPDDTSGGGEPLRGDVGAVGSIAPDAGLARVTAQCRARRVMLGRPCNACRGKNVELGYFDVFRSNPAAPAVVDAIDAERWLVYGSSFDYCLRVTAAGLCALGQKVTVLEDLTLPSPRSTEESMAQTRASLSEAGVSWSRLDTFLEMTGEGGGG